MALATSTSLPTAAATFLTLPLEIRLKIYNYVLASSHITSIRPQRKIGWNRSPPDLSNPALLFESDAHPILRELFHGKLTRTDHAAVLISLLHHARVLCVTHDDFAALQKLVTATTPPSVTVAMSGQAKSFAGIVKENLRCLDFSDQLDEIVCQPSDLAKLLKNLPGLKAVHVMSKHVQRYSGTIHDHVEFCKERAERELSAVRLDKSDSASGSKKALDPHAMADERRRLNLRSPMTDGMRMVISPALLSRRTTPASAAHWVVVDLSLLVWQHFLYSGAPYKDHWRCVKMQSLLDASTTHKFHVIVNFRTVEFDPCSAEEPTLMAWRITSNRLSRRLSARAASEGEWKWSGMFRGEMSTADWTLRLKHRKSSLEYAVRQRLKFDSPVKQHESGMVMKS